MRKMKILVLALLVVFVFTATMGCGSIGKKKFPERDLNGIIMWGAGGAMDNMSRSITPLVEQHLGKKIVLQNKPGGSGAIATQFVFDQKADGYTLLYGAENPQLYRIMELSNLDYKDFEPIIILARGTAVVTVPPDSKYQTIQDLINDGKANPGKINMGATGAGGLPFVVAAMLKATSGASFNLITFDGEGPALTNMLGGHVDFTATGIPAARELIRAGKVRALAVIANEPVPGLENIPPIGKLMPEYQKLLPWGPFYGVFVKKDTPKEIVDVLTNAFQKGYKEEKFQNFIKDFGAVPMGISGQEAKDFLLKWQQVTSWLMFDAGGAKKSPEEFGIKRVGQ